MCSDTRLETVMVVMNRPVIEADGSLSTLP